VVACGSCGGRFDLSTRRERANRKAGKAPRCQTCRRLSSLELTPKERERFRRWWLEESGLSERELHAIAVGLGVSRPPIRVVESSTRLI